MFLSALDTVPPETLASRATSSMEAFAFDLLLVTEAFAVMS
jgi:hypothetical protein